MSENQSNPSVGDTSVSPQNRATGDIEKGLKPPFPEDFESIKKRLSKDARELLIMTNELDEKLKEFRGAGKYQLLGHLASDKDIIKPHGGILLPSAGIKIYTELKYLSQYSDASELIFLKNDLRVFERWFWITARNKLVGLAGQIKKLGSFLIEEYQVNKDSDYTETTPETFPILDFYEHIKYTKSYLTFREGSAFRTNKRGEQQLSDEEYEEALERGELSFEEREKLIKESTFEHKIFRAAWELYIESEYEDESLNIEQTKSLITDTIDQYLFKVADDWTEKLNSFKDLEKGEWRIFDAFLDLLVADLMKSGEIDDNLKDLCNQIIRHNFKTVQEEESWYIELAEMAIFIITLIVFKRPMTISIRSILIALNVAGIAIEANDLIQSISKVKEMEAINKAEVVDAVYQATSDKFRSGTKKELAWHTTAFILSLISTVADISQMKNIAKTRKIPGDKKFTIDGTEQHNINLTDPGTTKKASEKAQMELKFPRAKKMKAEPGAPKATSSEQSRKEITPAAKDTKNTGKEQRGTSERGLRKKGVSKPAKKKTRIPKRYTKEWYSFIQKNLFGRISDCPELLRLWNRARKNVRSWDEARTNFWKLVKNDPSDEAKLVRDMLEDAGLVFRKNLADGTAPVLRKRFPKFSEKKAREWAGDNPAKKRIANRLIELRKSGKIPKEDTVDRLLSFDHIVPRSENIKLLFNPANLQLMLLRDNLFKGITIF